VQILAETKKLELIELILRTNMPTMNHMKCVNYSLAGSVLPDVDFCRDLGETGTSGRLKNENA